MANLPAFRISLNCILGNTFFYISQYRETNQGGGIIYQRKLFLVWKVFKGGYYLMKWYFIGFLYASFKSHIPFKIVYKPIYFPFAVTVNLRKLGNQKGDGDFTYSKEKKLCLLCIYTDNLHTSLAKTEKLLIFLSSKLHIFDLGLMFQTVASGPCLRQAVTILKFVSGRSKASRF